MNFTLRQIRYFVATAESMSVNKASKALNLSQSALTNALAELENLVGVSLFNRSHKGVSLTHEGHQFLISSRRILASVADAKVNMHRIHNDKVGSLVVGVTSLVAGYYLSEPLRQFNHNYPKVKVTLHEDSQVYIEHQLVNGEIDVAILLIKQLKELDAFETETLTNSHLKVWLPGNHKLFDQSDISLQDLAEDPIISLTVDQIDQSINQAWRRYNKPVTSFIKTQSVEAVRNLVGAGLGVAIIPEFAYRPWTLDMQKIESRHIREELPSIDIGLVWRRGTRLNWAAMEFIDVARDHIRNL